MQPLKTGRTGPVERSDSAPSTAEREVTEALATAGAVGQGTATTPRPTAVLTTQPQSTHPVPVASRAPKRRVGRWVVAALVIVLALSAAGFGLARLDPAAWSRVTAWLPGSDEAAVASGSTNDGEAGAAA